MLTRNKSNNVARVVRVSDNAKGAKTGARSTGKSKRGSRSATANLPVQKDTLSEVNEMEIDTPYHPPDLSLSKRALSVANMSVSSNSSSQRCALHEKEPENPIPLKAALELLPKSFDGDNMSVNRFINFIAFMREILLPREIDNFYS